MPAVSIGSLPLYVNDPTGVTLLIRDPSNSTTLRITREQLLTGLGPGGGVTSFNTRTGIVTLQASDIRSLGVGIVSSSTFSSPSQGTLTTNINGVSQNVDLGLQTGDSVQFSQVTATLIGNASTATTAATASSADTFIVRQSLTGSNALFTGTITAQSLVVQTVSSSVSFITGSTKFGSQSTNTHQFTGSVTVTGSFAVTGPATITNLTGSLFGSSSYALTASHVPDGIIGTGSANYLAKFNGNRSVTSSLLYDNGAAIGLGTISPEGAFDISYGFNGGGGALSLGADYGDLYTRTNNTRKYALVTAAPYVNTRFNTALLAHDSDGTDNILHVGGTGGVGVNSPTSIRFYTTSSTTDSIGTLRMIIDGDGQTGIGFSNPTAKFHVSSSTSTVAIFEQATAPRIVLKSNTNNAYLSYNGSIALGYSATHTSNILFITSSGVTISGSLSITGLNTTNRVLRLDSSNVITGSILYDIGTAVGLGTTSPEGAFDISYGGPGAGGALTIGADYGDLYTRTNNTRKYALVTAVPYTNARFNTALLTHDSDGTDNILHIGGTGDVGVNSPTSIRFYTTSSAATDGTGVVRMVIDGNGRVGIGRGSGTPASVLHVSSSTPTVATFEHSTAPRIVLKSSAIDAYLSYTGSIAIGYSATHTDNILFITSSGITVSGSQISFVDLPSATKTEVVYFDTATKRLSYGPGATISGIDGYITRFSGSSAISRSVMYESASNIGIGTTSPDNTLDVNGTTKIRTINQASTAQPKFIVASAAGLIQYRSGPELLSDIGGASAADYVTIGTTQTVTAEKTFNSVIKADLGLDTLDGQGLTWRAASYGAANARINFTNASGMIFYSDGTVTPTMFLSDDGNRRVGIGTITPNAKLDVNGNAIVTGSLSVTAGITGSLFGTSSWAFNATTASFVTTAQTASFVTTAQTASFVTTAQTASFVATASWARNAITSSYVTGSVFSASNLALSASYALTASYALGNVGGSGTINRVAKFTAPATIGNSNIFDDGTNVQITGSTVTISGSTSVLMPGNVGIGTASPSVRLDVSGSGKFTVGTNGTVDVTDNGTITLRSQIGAEGRFGTLTNHPLVLSTNNSEKLRIDTSGNVGIALTSPSVRLHVSGSSSTSTVQRLQRGIQGSDSGMSTIFGAPYIQVGGGEFYANGVQTIGFGYTNGTSYQPVEIGYQATDVSTFTRGDLVFATRATLTNVAPTEKMRITSNGQIVFANYTGSGAFPGSAAATLGVDINGNVITTSGGSVTGTGVANYIALFNGASSLTASSIYQDSNQIGIGLTAPTSVLHVSSAAATVSTFEHATSPRMRLKAGANSSYLSYDGTSLGLGFSTTHASNVLFVSSSSVGVGIATPGATLDVNGTLYSRNNLSVGRDGAGSEYFLDIGAGRSGNGFAYIDLIGDATYTDYGFRIIRGNGGANTTSELVHRGTGDFKFSATEAAAFRFTNAGGERLTVLSTGDVGIGTTSPGAKLEVKSGNIHANTGSIYARATGTEGSGFQFSAITLGYDSTNNYGWITSAGAAARDNLVLQAGGGSVGIGTTSPATKLDVRSGVITAGSDSSTNGTEIIRGYYVAGALTVIGSERSTGGPVIGYAVKPSTSAADAFLSSTSINIARGAYTIAGADHKWYTGSAQTVAENSPVTMGRAMTLTSTGFLGIGTDTPATRLDVNGNLSLSGFNFARNAGNYNQIYTQAGNIGIYLGGLGDEANYYDNTSHYFRSKNGAANYAFLNATGLSVGKVSPTAMLDVNGNAIITGSLTLSGSAGVELRVIGDSVITGSLIVSGANGAGIFSQGATLVDYLTGISNSGSYVAWRAPFSCSVVAMYGYKEGGGNAEVNAEKVSGGTTSRHKNTNITVSSNSTWTGDSTIANANYAPGDYLKLIMSGSANNQIAVQVDFIRRA